MTTTPTTTAGLAALIHETADRHDLPRSELCAPHEVPRSILTNGPTVSVTILRTGRTLTAGYEPERGTWQVWTRSGSTSGIRTAADLIDALDHHAGSWTDDPATWTVRPAELAR